MSLKIPRNIIIEPKYTQGKEYMTIDTYKEYQGYYYELNDKIFAGKEFDVFAPELIRLSSNKINPLLTRLSTYAYAALSQKQNDILSTIINVLATDINPNTDKSGEETYYNRKINEIPYSIKQITKETYINILKDPIYQSVIVKADYSNIDQAEQQIPGLKAFLGIQ
jgi:glycogen synthase